MAFISVVESFKSPRTNFNKTPIPIPTTTSTPTPTPRSTVIREATLEDIPEVVQMVVDFADSTKSRQKFEVNPERVDSFVREVINNSDGHVLVLEENGNLVGMIGIFIYPHQYSGERVATEFAWWVTPEARESGVKLLRKAESWAREKGAKSMIMVALTEKVGKFYERLGYHHIEDNYELRIGE
jgi:N-acetylglutamate synthase-like GNAT family acetyltransferase